MPSVYLLHLDPPYKHAKHYCGWTGNSVNDRLEQHRAGRGARLLKVHIANGGTWRVARVWEFDDWKEARKKERSIKKKASTRYCPICKANTR